MTLLQPPNSYDHKIRPSDLSLSLFIDMNYKGCGVMDTSNKILSEYGWLCGVQQCQILVGTPRRQCMKLETLVKTLRQIEEVQEESWSNEDTVIN